MGAENPDAPGHQPEGQRGFVKPDMIGSPVLEVEWKYGVVVERGSGGVIDQIPGDKGMVSLIPVVQESIARRVPAERDSAGENEEDRKGDPSPMAEIPRCSGSRDEQAE